MSAKHVPTELRAPEGARRMEIDWSDGHLGIYPHTVLRGFCPCATCQGHQGPVRFVDSGNPAIETIEEIGNYALRFVWEDGHATGIYSFEFLRRLCACSQCVGEDPTRREFSR